MRILILNMGRSANERVSLNGCAAHEIVGRYETWKKGAVLDDIVLVEAQASIWVAKFGIGSSVGEREILMADAVERHEKAGIVMKWLKIYWIYGSGDYECYRFS